METEAKRVYNEDALLKALARHSKVYALRTSGAEGIRNIESPEEQQLSNFLIRGWEAWDTHTAFNETIRQEINHSLTKNDKSFSDLLKQLDDSKGILLTVAQSRYVDEAEDLTEKLTALTHKLMSLKDELATNKRILSDELQAANKLRDEFGLTQDSLKQQYVDVQKQGAQNFAALRIAKAFEVSKVTKSLRDAEERLASGLASCKEEARAELEIRMRDFRGAETDIKTRAMQELKVAKESYIAELNRLQEQNRSLMSMRDELNSKNSSLESRIAAALEKCNADAANLTRTYQDQIDRARRDLQIQFETQNFDVKDTYEKSIGSVRSEYETERGRLLGELNGAKQRIISLETERDSIMSSRAELISRSQAQLEDLRVKYQSALSQIEEQRRDLESSRMAVVRATEEVEAMKARGNALQVKLEEANNKLTNMMVASVRNSAERVALRDFFEEVKRQVTLEINVATQAESERFLAEEARKGSLFGTISSAFGDSSREQAESVNSLYASLVRIQSYLRMALEGVSIEVRSNTPIHAPTVNGAVVKL